MTKTQVSEADIAEKIQDLESPAKRALRHAREALEDVLDELPADLRSVRLRRTIKQRVKQPESTWRKARARGIKEIGYVPGEIDDFLGIRIIVPSKQDAAALFSHLQGLEKDWFCAHNGEIHFHPYTVSSRDRHAITTGYQAYHISFVLKRSYGACKVKKWPVEIQVMSSLWAFWADFSRRQFYKTEADLPRQLQPVTAAIAKLLDSADDLIINLTEALQSESDDSAAESQSTPTKAGGAWASEEGVRDWFEEKGTRYFGNRVNVPKDIFITKISQDLELYGITIPDIEAALDSGKAQALYRAVLAESGVEFLPPYQKILFFALWKSGLAIETIIDRVNAETRLLGVELKLPSLPETNGQEAGR